MAARLPERGNYILLDQQIEDEVSPAGPVGVGARKNLAAPLDAEAPESINPFT
jgi:hypothetical protein